MIWKQVKGYEGFYEANEEGVIRSIPRKNTKGGVLRPGVCRGYLTVGLSKYGKQRSIRAHRVIAETFIDNPNNYSDINHKDGNKKNNKVSNLEWCSHSQNMKHASKIGLLSVESRKGEKNVKAKLTKAKVFEIRRRLKSERNVDLAKEFNVTRQNIRMIKLKKTWKHI